MPTGFLNEEVRDGYRISATMKKIWAIEIDILMQIQDICDRYNIKWFVEGGTLLGTVRHKGFIPWDDDIDIEMMRPDYERFIEVAQKELKHPYSLLCHETNPYCISGHAQIGNLLTTAINRKSIFWTPKCEECIFVDIFPIDAIPDDEEDAKFYVEQCHHYKEQARVALYNAVYRSFPRLGDPKHFISNYKELIRLHHEYSKSGVQVFCQHYDKFSEGILKYNDKGTEHVASFALGWNNRKFWQTDWFKDVTYLPFEWFKVPVMSGYISYLDIMYGDWHRFVIGTSMHGSMLFDPDISYTEYRSLLKRINLWFKSK